MFLVTFKSQCAVVISNGSDAAIGSAGIVGGTTPPFRATLKPANGHRTDFVALRFGPEAEISIRLCLVAAVLPGSQFAVVIFNGSDAGVGPADIVGCALPAVRAALEPSIGHRSDFVVLHFGPESEISIRPFLVAAGRLAFF